MSQSTQRQLHPKEVSLSDLMRRSQKGDGSAYRQLLEQARILILAYSSRGLTRMGIRDPGAAEDLVQETLLAIHKKRHTYDGGQLFTPWLFAIARYKLIDFARSRRREAGNVDIERVAEGLLGSVDAQGGAADDIAGLLASLPEKQRAALQLVKLDGLSISEASQKTRMSESAIKVSIHRAIKSLRRIVSHQEDKEENRK